MKRLVLVGAVGVATAFSAWVLFSSPPTAPVTPKVDAQTEPALNPSEADSRLPLAPVMSEDRTEVDVPHSLDPMVVARIPPDIPQRATLPTMESAAFGGFVRDASGRPVAGARVTAGRPFWSEAGAKFLGASTLPGERLGWVQRVVTTNEDGWYQIDGLAPGGVQWLKAERGCDVGVVGPCEPPPRKRTLVDIEVRPGSRVRGKVLTAESEEPVDRAWVNITGANFNFPVRTNGVGRFDAGVVPVGQYQPTVVKPMWGSDERQYQLFPGRTEEITLHVSPRRRVHGFLMDQRGAPIAGGKLHVRRRSQEASDVDPWAISLQDGSFEIAHVPYDDYEIEAVGPGYVPRVTRGVEPRLQPIRIELAEERVVRFRAVHNGHPLHVASVIPSTDRTSSRIDYRWMRDRDGWNRVVFSRDGEYQLAIVANGYWMERIGPLQVGPGVSHEQTVAFEGGAELWVTVETSSGVAAPGAQVTVTSGRDTNVVESDTHGMARLLNLEPGEYTVHVRKDAQIVSESLSIDVARRVLRIQFPPLGRIVGRVASLDDAAPGPVIVTTFAANHRLVAPVDPETGAFVLDQLSPGRYRLGIGLADNRECLFANLPPRADPPLEVWVREGEESSCELRAPWETRGRLRVVVRVDGAPLAGGYIQVTKSGDSQIKQVRTERIGTTMAGAAIAAFICPGDYRLTAYSDATGGPFDLGNVTIKPSEEASVSRSFSMGGLSGRVVQAATGSPLAKVTVTACLAHSMAEDGAGLEELLLPTDPGSDVRRAVARQVTDQEGRFSFARLGCGDLRMLIRRSGGASQEYDVSHRSADTVVEIPWREK